MISSIILKLLSLIFISINYVYSYDEKITNKLSKNNTETIKFQKYKEYCVSYNYWKLQMPLDEVNDPRITLVLHSTINYISYLKDQIDTWEGPISLALVIPPPKKIKCPTNETKDIECGRYSDKKLIFFKILDFFSRQNDISRVSLHLIFENKKLFTSCPVIEKHRFDDTKNTSKYVMNLIEESKKEKKYFDVYPINVARNIGRNGKETELFFSGDIEQICSDKYESKVRKLAKSEIIDKKKNIVLVHRRFEMDEKEKYPRNKKELRKLYNKKKVLIFHQLIYKNGHYIPNLEEWFKEPEILNEGKIFKKLSYFDPGWEPQFVGGSNVPYHDENFPYRIRSNTHLAHIMCYKNFEFAILSDQFTVHKGIKHAFEKQKTITREVKIKTYNYSLKFNKKLKKSYPKRGNICKPLVVYKV
uniref:N-acetyllactosaminide beta-1,3-N-acetylglucosaminyltransferase n=1 Tax=Strongyloides papillosus TaxID=174720 RepID=A0A0N5BVI3_STREA